MKKIEAFQTTDGELFTCARAAQWHQQEVDDVKMANVMLAEGESIGHILEATNPYHSEAEPILSKVTKDSKLSIGHWQCIDKPGYKVTRFESYREVFIYSDVGSWSGSYGAATPISNLVSYAKHERSEL